jgi:hypothetical protein
MANSFWEVCHVRSSFASPELWRCFAAHRVFKSDDDILDHCCFAWNKLIDTPWKIPSIGTRETWYKSEADAAGIRTPVQAEVHCVVQDRIAQTDGCL